MTRGIRNNNPFNIKKSNNKWLGKKAVSSDPDFEQFESMELGIRAGFVIFRTYICKYHLNCVSSILDRFCPGSNKDYKIFVTSRIFDAGFAAVNITFGSESFFVMVSSILKFESDLDYDINDLKFLFDLYHF